MGNKPENVPAEELNTTEPINPSIPDGTDQAAAPVPAKPDPVKPEPDQTKVGEIVDTTPPAAPAPKEEKPQPRMVPEAVVIQLKKDMKELQKQVAAGDVSTKAEISQSLKDIGEKHDVDPDFLQEFAAAVRSETEAEFNARLESELEPFKKQSAEANKAKADKVFTEHFNKTLESMPEYKGVAKESVIRALAFDPRNADKTFADLFEEAYGDMVGERRTFDGAGPGSGKDNAEIDFDRAAKDTKYFDTIMANPLLKKKYNEGLEGRLKL